MEDLEIENIDSQSSEKVFTPIKIFYTASIMFMVFAFGLEAATIGPALVDMEYIFQVSLSTMSNAPLLVGVGYMFGALFAGQISRFYKNRQILIACFLIPMALVPCIVLLVRSFGVALFLFFIFGMGPGAIDATASVWVIELWPKHNSIVLPLAVSLFGLGQVAGPSMMSQFVRGVVNETEHVTPEDRIHSLIIPYSISGALNLIVPALFLIFNFTSLRYVSSVKSQDELEKKKDPRITNNPYRILHLMIAGIAIAFYGGAEQGWSSFSATMFQHFGGGTIHASEAALLQAFWSSAFAVGLLLSALIALRLSPDTIIFYHFIIVFASLILMYLKNEDKTFVYISTIAFGWGMSALWAMKFAFIEKYLMMTDKIASIFSCLFGFSGIVVPVIMGRVDEENNPKVLIIVQIILLSLSAFCFLVLKLWLMKVEKHHGPAVADKE